MKVTITADMKKVIPVADMPAVNEVIKTMRYDSTTAKEAAESAARIASGNNSVKVLEANAEIASNARIWDYYNYDSCSAHYDMWINFTAIINNGFDGIIMGGAYLSDIQSATGYNDEELRSHMYIRKFTESK